MKKLIVPWRVILKSILLAVAAAVAPSAPAAAQAVLTLPQINNAGGNKVPAGGAVCTNVDGTACRFGDGAATVAATSAPLAGASSTTQTVGPFTPQLARAIWVTLSGTWAGSAQLLRSTDGGTTKLPLTVGGQTWASFTANANEAVGEESVSGATYYLAITLTSGSVTYRVQQ